MTTVCRISVVIPTRNRPEQLTACLQSLEQGFPADAETIVVCDGPQNDLEPLLGPFAKMLRLRWITGPSQGPSAARNRGLAVARGDIVAFLDDDCRPRAGWLNALVSEIETNPPRATGGTTLNGLKSNLYAHTAQLILDLVAQYERKKFGSERFFPSNNFAFPAEQFSQIGGFNESFRTAEDREVCRRWLRAGFEFVRVPDALIEHDPQLDFLGFVSKFFAYGKGAAKFHSSGNDSSIWQSFYFHLRLLFLAPAELLRIGAWRGVLILGLLFVWEFVNLAGFLSIRIKRPATAVAVTTARSEQIS